MAKKRYRIYKAGGEKGKVRNLAAQFLNKAQMGMEQQQVSQDEQMMMVIQQIKNAIMQTAPIQEVLEFIVTTGLAEDISTASDVYKQVKDELVNSGEMASQESEDVAMATNESDQMMMPEAQEGITMEERDADSATNDIPVGGRSEQLDKFVGTLKQTGNKAVAKEAMAAEGPAGTGALVARDGLTLNQRRTNRRIARFADQMSPKYDFSDRRKIRRGLNKGEITMGDVFDEANMPSFESSDNDLVQTVDPETGSRIFVRNRKGLLGKLKQDIYAENIPLSQLSMMYGPSTYASGIYGRSGTYGTTGSTYSTSGNKRSEIYYTKPTVLEAAYDINDDNIPEASEVNNSNPGSTNTNTNTKTKNKTKTNSSNKASGKPAEKPEINKVSQTLSNKESEIENSRFLNTLTDLIIKNQVSQYNRQNVGTSNYLGGYGASGISPALALDDLTYLSNIDTENNDNNVPNPMRLSKPIMDYVEGPDALGMDKILELIKDQPLDVLIDYMSMYPTGSVEQITIGNAIAEKESAASAAETQSRIDQLKKLENPSMSAYDNKGNSTARALGDFFSNKTARDIYFRGMFGFNSPFQEGGYIDSTNPDLYKFTGGGDYFADGGMQLEDVTDPYMVKAQDGAEMMSEQPNPGETMKDYFIRTGREDQLQYISPEQQGQVYGEGEAGVASLNDPYANEQNQYGAFTNPNDPDALENSIQEQADVTRSITGTGEEDRDIDATKQEAKDLGYFGNDDMNFMSRYDAWKQGGKSQNIEDGFTSGSTSTDNSGSTGVYGSYGGRRKGRGLFPFISNLTGGNRLIDRRDDLSYLEIKGLQKDENGNPLPIDMNRITDFKSKSSFNPRTGKSRYKNRIKFGDPQGGNNSKDTEADDKPGFFDRVKDKAGSMIEGFRDKNKPQPNSDKPALPYQEEGPTYQQQIEGDGSEYDEMIMNDARAAGAIKDEPAPKASQSDIDQMIEQDRMFNRGEMLDNSNQQTFAPTTRSASGQIDTSGYGVHPNAGQVTYGNAAKRQDYSDGNFSNRQLRKADYSREERDLYKSGNIEGAEELRRNRRALQQFGGANNVMQFANRGAVTDFSLIDPTQPDAPQPDAAVNNEGMLDFDGGSSMADDMMSFNPAMPENPDAASNTTAEPENLEDCTEEQKRDTTSKCYDPEVAQSGTIRMKKKDPYDVRIGQINKLKMMGQDIVASGLGALNESSQGRQGMKKVMFPDDNYTQVPSRGGESERTRLQIGDSGAKSEMIKGQNYAKFGGSLKEGEVYDLSMARIKEIIANGGQIEFI